MLAKVETLKQQLGINPKATASEAISQAVKDLGVSDQANGRPLIEQADLCLQAMVSTTEVPNRQNLKVAQQVVSKRQSREVEAELATEQQFQETMSSEITALFAQARQLTKEVRGVREDVRRYAGQDGEGSKADIEPIALARTVSSAALEAALDDRTGAAINRAESVSSFSTVTSRGSVSSCSGDTIRS